MEDLKKVEAYERGFPSSFYHKGLAQKMHREAVLNEIRLLKEIKGEYYNHLVKQDMINKDARLRKLRSLLNDNNSSTKIILATM